jgi:hypothetical protein
LILKKDLSWRWLFHLVWLSQLILLHGCLEGFSLRASFNIVIDIKSLELLLFLGGRH